MLNSASKTNAKQIIRCNITHRWVDHAELLLSYGDMSQWNWISRPGTDQCTGPITYQMGYGSFAVDMGNSAFRIPAMLGYGGNWLLMMPNATCFRIQDDYNMELNGMAEVTFTVPE